MKTKIRLFHIPVFIAALWSSLALAGFPGNVRFTPPRILMILAVWAGCCLWLFILRYRDQILSRKNTRAVCFQSAVLIACFCLILVIAGQKLAPAEGVLYRLGAFLRQAEPFLLFLSLLCVCAGALFIITLKTSDSSPLRTLLTESTGLYCILIVMLAELTVYGAFIPLRANYYPSHDYSIFAYIGQQILRGKIPYTQLWDHKPPVIFYLNAAALKLAGGELTGIWLMEIAAFFTGTLILFRLLSRKYPKWLAISVLATGILHYVRVLDFGNYTEEASLFFSAAALGLYFIGRPFRHSILRGFVCGALCGLAFTSKQNTVGCWIALFLIDFYRSVSSGRSPDMYRACRNFWLGAAGGFIAVNAGWVIYFAAHHALEAYWDVAFWFNWIYSEQSGDSRLACAWTTLSFLPSVSLWLLFGYFSWIASFVYSCKNGLKRFIEDDPLCAWALIDLPFELLFAGLSGMNYQHYFILCIMPITILLCAVLAKLMPLAASKIGKDSGRRYPLYSGVFTVLLLVLASLPLYKYFRANYEPRTPSSYTKIRDYLLRDTLPEKPILVWGSRSAIYVMSSRNAPTAYFNERPLYLFPGEIRASQWEELLNDLRNDPPQVIINTRDSALPFIKYDKKECVIPDGADYTVPLYRYFCENYHYETTVNPEFQDAWDIYRISH